MLIDNNTQYEKTKSFVERMLELHKTSPRTPQEKERVSQQKKSNQLFCPQDSDWRSMVDSVMIDSDYDGKVFNISLTDVPEKKNDLVEGMYTVEAKKARPSRSR